MILDPDRNWQARIAANQASQALSDARHARNARTAAFWTGIFFTVAAAAMLVGIWGVIR